MSAEVLSRAQIGGLVAKVATWNPRVSGSNRAIRYIDISSVNREAKVINGVVEVAAHEAPSRARQLVRTGDVLVSTVRPNLNAVACVGADLDGATASTGYCVLRANPTLLDFRYLYHWVRSGRFVRDMTRRATGASYPAVTDRIVKDSLIPLPSPEDRGRSLREQRRIAAILDQADAIRRKRRQALETANDLIPAIFHDMFGDPVANPKEWLTVDMGSIAADMSYGTSVKCNAALPEGAMPVLRIPNVAAGKVLWGDLKYAVLPDKEVDRLRLKEDDLLFVRTNGNPDYIGRCAVFDGPREALFASYLIRVRVRPGAG